MSGISSTDLLKNTLTLVRLARETAVARGRTAQVERFTPLVDDLKKVVENVQDPSGTSPVSTAIAQNDFRSLLSVMSSQQKVSSQTVAPAERNQIVVALAAGGMSEIDVARRMSMTLDEVRTLLQIDNRKNALGKKGG